MKERLWAVTGGQAEGASPGDEVPHLSALSLCHIKKAEDDSNAEIHPANQCNVPGIHETDLKLKKKIV